MKRTHGRTRVNGKATKVYKAWENMHARCYNPNTQRWKHYGGRSIQVKYADFQEFLADVGEPPSPQHSIDRIDNDGHYEPGNVRWATASEQSRNRRSWKKKHAERSSS